MMKMENLLILHKKKVNADEAGFCSVELSWDTCMRSIGFQRFEVSGLMDAAYDVYRNEQAYEFLLQIICGLRSPILAETEVMGQFRDFVSHTQSLQSEQYAQYQPLFRQLLTDAKQVRTAHLKSLGSQTYGSMVRRLIGSGRRVQVLGAGRLASEILPWLDGQTSVTVRCRRPDKVGQQLPANQLANLRLEDWEKTSSDRPDVLIVAAPISNLELLNVATSAKTLIDLREARQSAGLAFSAERKFDLNSFFEQFRLQTDQAKAVKARAIEAVRVCAQQYRDQSTIRPFGWEDLCG
ncbi:MAG: hypothetical protein HRT45_09640 [Bdellovibrionales bacterium]|nr:hypothetical protein [Bdellovibrionales bacterium]